ncbi:MAG: hypothetical protein KF893_08315 [Caldilineaceae bacterium]|nr:hypothetical protein [Caldilineaceae bacterium]
MANNRYTKIAMLCALVTVLAAVAAAVGIFFRGNGAAVEVTSVRGESYLVITEGIYRFNSQRMVAEGVGWDIFTLFMAVPAMLIALPKVARGSLHARLFAIGLLAYFFYQYFMYALTWALGPLLLLFIPIYTLSFAAAAWIVSTIPIDDLARRASARFPRRGMAILCVLLSLFLILSWLRMILAGLAGDFETGALLGQTTMVVQAMDLGMIVPLALFTAIAIWMRWAVGYLLSIVFVVKAVAMAGAICAMLFMAWAVEGAPEVGSLIIFGAVAVAALWLGIRMYRSLEPVAVG